MTLTELLTEVLVPMGSPLVAAIAIVLAVRAEGRKIRLQRSNEHRQRVDSIFTDCLYARDLYTILTYQYKSGRMNPAHLTELQKTADRAFGKIFSDPEAGRRLYDQVRFTGAHNNIFRLLAEMRVRIANQDPDEELDLFIYFGLTTLLYLYDSDEARRDEMYGELEKVKEANMSDYGNLMVDKSTNSLRSSA